MSSPIETRGPTTLPELCIPIFVFGFQLRDALGSDENALGGDSLVDGDLVRARKGAAGGSTLDKMGIGDGPGATRARRKPKALSGKGVTGGPGMDDGDSAFTSELRKNDSFAVNDDEFAFSLELSKQAPPPDDGKALEAMEAAMTSDEEAEGDREADGLRVKIDTMFAQLERHAAHAAALAAAEPGTGNVITQQDVQNAKFALVAYLDELIMSSPKPVGRVWANNPMQLEYFNDFNAGEKFYENLEELRHGSDARTVDLLEIYYMCLVLGFKGKFASRQGREKRKLLMDNLSRELVAARSKNLGGLAPDAISAEIAMMEKPLLPLWLVPAIASGVIVVMFLLFALLLGGQISGFERVLQQPAP